MNDLDDAVTKDIDNAESFHQGLKMIGLKHKTNKIVKTNVFLVSLR